MANVGNDPALLGANRVSGILDDLRDCLVDALLDLQLLRREVAGTPERAVAARSVSEVQG